jgi:hypothetical protein
MASTPPASVRPWYFRPRVAVWLGPLLIIACLALRFGWGGLAGPPFPFWGITYLIGAAGIFITYVWYLDRGGA